jgi:hypothetical protein
MRAKAPALQKVLAIDFKQEDFIDVAPIVTLRPVMVPMLRQSSALSMAEASQFSWEQRPLRGIGTI